MKGLLSVTDHSSNAAPKEVYNWKLVSLAVSAALGSAMFGYDTGYISGTLNLPSFKARFGLDQADGNDLAALQSNIVSTFQGGCFFGCMFAYVITEVFGRKVTLMLSGAVLDVGVVLQLAANGSVGMFYAGRIITGLAVGTTSMIVPIYIAEWAPPAIRGRLVGIYEAMYQSALVVAFWVSYGVKVHQSDTSDQQWYIPVALQMIFGTGVTLAMAFQPETYRWLIKKGKEERAIKNICWVRNLDAEHPYIQWELETVREQIESERELAKDTTVLSLFKECGKKGIRFRIALCVLVMMFQNLSGINALNYYAPDIFRSIGFKGDEVELLATGVFGIIKALTNYAFVLVGIDRFGRRKTLLTGCVGTIVAMFYLAIYTQVSGSFDKTVPKDAGAYFAIIMVYVFALFYTFSWNGVPYIYCAEILPNRLRTLGMMFAVLTQWLFQFMVVYSNPYMMTNIKYGTFYFFGAWLIISWFFAFYCMPETQGLALEDMDIMFNANGTARAKRRKTDEVVLARREQRDAKSDSVQHTDEVTA